METEIKSHYNYEEVILWLEKKGIDLYGNHFKILETDHPIIYKLIAYFLKDEATCFQFDIDLNKGILLSGPVGCGKTSLINLMKYLTPTEHKFFNYFSSNGWLVGGKTPMVNWQAAAQNWILNAPKFISNEQPNRAKHLNTGTDKDYSEPL